MRSNSEWHATHRTRNTKTMRHRLRTPYFHHNFCCRWRRRTIRNEQKKNSGWERKKEKQNSVLELFIRKMVGMPKSRFIPKVWLFFFLHSFFTAAEAVYFAPTSPNISINFYMRLTRHISSARTAHTAPILSSYQWLDNNNNNRIESMNVCWAEWLSSNSVVV